MVMGLPRHLPGFDNLRREHHFERLTVKGEIPQGLRGTLYANGPSLSSLFGERYPHWFDGDGAIAAVRFGNDEALGSVRLVQSAGLQMERRAGRMLYGGYRRRFHPSLLWRGPTRRGKNAANTNVLWHHGRLYALWEGGRPTELDPDSLATLGERDFGGAIKGTYSAHPKVVDGFVYSFGIRLAGQPVRLDVFRTDPDGHTTTIASPRLSCPTMIHDFLVSENYIIFFVSPIRFRRLRALVGLGGFEENLSWEPERGTEILLIDRHDPERTIRFSTDPFFQFHFAHAFEHGTEVVVDYIHFDDFYISEWIRRHYLGLPHEQCYGVPTRARIDVSSRRIRRETLWHQPCEFPVSGGLRPSRPGNEKPAAEHIFCCAHHDAAQTQRTSLDRLARLDLQNGDHQLIDLGHDRFPSEPRLVRGETDAWLLSFVYDANEHRSFVAIVNARSLEMVGQCWFDQHIPPRFHSTFVPTQA